HVDAVPGAVDEAVDGGEARARLDDQWSGPGHARGTCLHRARGGGAARGGLGDLDLAPGHGEQYDREGRRGGEGTATEHGRDPPIGDREPLSGRPLIYPRWAK